MPNFTAGTSFTDGVTNDVTAAKLNALVADAVPTSSLALASTSGTISNFTSSTATLLGAITGSTNVINIGSGQIYKDGSGNVGIGTTSPATQLQINSSAATYSDQLRIRNTNFGNADIGVGSGIMAIATDMANITFHTSSNLGTTGSSVPSNERLRIDTNGNVGIGTTSPSSFSGKLVVNNGTNKNITNRGGIRLSGSVIQSIQDNAATDSPLEIYSGASQLQLEGNPITFYNNGERLRIDASGNVGIGMTPSFPLDISSSTGNLRMQSTTGTNLCQAQLINGSATLRVGVETSVGGSIVGGSAPYSGVISNASNFPLAFGTNNTERLRIDSSGNVGIGTGGTAAASKLDVYGLGNFQGLEVGKSGQTGNRVAGIDFTGDDTYTDYGFRIIRQNTGANADTALTNRGTGGLVIRTEEAGDIVLQTTNTERMRIAAGGNIGIGTASPSAQLELSTDSAKKPSTNTWTIASDQRLKTNITNADNDRCYEIVKQVPLKRYTWRSEVYSEGQVKDRSKLGWIAQDVEAVFPKAVGTNRFAYNQVFEDVVTPELDSDGNAVLDENGVAKTKTEKRLVSEDVIEDCKDLNSDQIYAAMYGTIQKLIEKVEFLESKVATLEAA